MLANYLSVVYDLTSFGISKIRNAIVSSDMDDNITIEVSFDGGKSFYKINKLNTKFEVPSSTGKIQVRITFEDIASPNIYKVKTTGFFQNLGIGTTANFTNTTTNTNYSTTIGRNGQYNISLPRGIYDVWYTNASKREMLMSQFNPEIVYKPTHRLDKEAIIDGIFSDVAWAKYSVFDTFVDKSKMMYGNTIVDPEGDLSDGVTDRKCRFWAIGFE